MLHTDLRCFRRSPALVILRAGLAFSLAACEGGGSTGDAPNTGLAALSSGKNGAAMRSPAAPSAGAKDPGTIEDLSGILDRAAPRRAADPNFPVNGAAPTSATSGNVTVSRGAGQAGEGSPAANTGLDAAAPTGPRMKEQGKLAPADRVQALARDLRDALAESSSARSEFVGAVAAAALETVSPGRSGAEGAGLSPGQQRVVASVRDLLASLTRGTAADGDPEKAAEAFERAREELNAGSVRVERLALCRRVIGFGRYDPLPAAVFVAGRPARAVVYTELEGFTHRTARESDPGASEQSWTAGHDTLWAVDVSQEVGLWASDGSLQWKLPEEAVVEVARNKRRDFFLVRQVELPSTLSVGNYTLKVTVRDRTSGAADELTLALSIVADPNVAARSSKSATASRSAAH